MKSNRGGLMELVLLTLCVIAAAGAYMSYADMLMYRAKYTATAEDLGKQISENQELRHKQAMMPAQINAALGNLGQQLRYQTARAQNAEKRVEELKKQCYSKGVLVP